MLRFLILSGYFELVMYLQVSGKLNQYINIHYSYLAYISMVLSFILAVVQLIVWMKQMKVHSHLSGRVAKVASIVLLAFPVLTGLLVPTVTLDANTVSAKGYHFPRGNDYSVLEARHQLLLHLLSLWEGNDQRASQVQGTWDHTDYHRKLHGSHGAHLPLS